MPVYNKNEIEKRKGRTDKNFKNPYFVKVSYKDHYGNIKQKKKEGFATKKEALAFERSFLDKAGASDDMLFSSLKDLYFEHGEHRWKETTLENKLVLFNLKILPYFKDMKINDIKPVTVSKWQNELISQGYSETYLKTIHNQLSAILNHAVKFYGLPTNAAQLNGPMGKKNADTMQFYTVAEFKHFISYFSNKPTSKLIFEILFWTGIRSGELLALTPNDFNFADKTLTINKSYARIKTGYLVKDPKTATSKRIVSIPDFLSNQLKDYLNKLTDCGPKDRIFQYSKSFLSLEMKRAAKSLNIKKIRVHDLRHSHASLLIEFGFTPLLVAERLGHKNIQTTLSTYSHLYPNKQKEVSNKLDEIEKTMAF